MIKGKTYLPLAAVAALGLGLYGCGGGDGPATGGSTMMPEPELDPGAANPQATASAIDLVASWARRDANDNVISGWWIRDAENESGNQEHLSHVHRDGSFATPVISYDANGPQFNVGLFQLGDPLQDDPWAQAGRFITTYEIGDDREGVTTSREVVTGHGLGAEWHAEELTKDYENGGTLEIGVVSDVKSTDGAADQWETATDDAQNILLDGAPAVPPDRDFVWVRIGNGDTIDGSLGGVEGSFACANSDGCGFALDRGEAGFTAHGDGITFTPAGGAAQAVTPISYGATLAADYLAFGYWLYVPEDVTATEDYDFGVYASGGDPFEAANLAGLTGPATYAGSAVGWYYVNKSSASPDNGLFTASVTLTAEFGDGTETGTVTGTVSDFDWPAEVESSLPATLTLSSDNWKGNTDVFGFNYTADQDNIVRGESNIFDTPRGTNANAHNGGHVLGRTYADVSGTDWFGEWQSAFFGNDPNDPNAHPTSMAGTFMASDQSVSGLQSESGLAGGFGAHKQDEQQ